MWTLERYVSLVLRFHEEDENFTCRLLARELPRLFHDRSPERQAEILAERPPLAGLPFWDALLTAVAEHLAVLHGRPVPEWADEPEGFLDPPQTRLRDPGCDYEARACAPPAFQRHGALIDPSELDPCGGERHEWIPGCWNWRVPQRPCPWKPDWRPPTVGEVKASEDALAAVYEQDKAERRAQLAVEDPELLAELIRDGLL